MRFGDRLKAPRDERNLSQADIELRTGLLRCYISRIENGHTVPAFPTIEKFARGLEVPLFQLFYDGESPPELPKTIRPKGVSKTSWGTTGKEARFMEKFRRLLPRISENDRKLLVAMAQKMARRKK